MTQRSETQGGAHPALIRALRRLLHPLIRLLIREGITLPPLVSLLKAIYVQVADEDFAPAEGRQTDSRISLLTGVHRKDIKRLRGRNHDAESNPNPTMSLSAQIIALWAGRAEFLDAKGAPRPLPRSGNGEPSFESLVTSVSKDIRPGAVLDDWLQRGLTHVDSRNRIVLTEAALVPRKDMEELAFFLGRNLHDHIAACDHNLSGAEPPFVERAVYYDGLSAASVSHLQETAKSLGMDTLLALNREARALADQDEGASGSVDRMSFGVYFYGTGSRTSGQE